jgi:hypothetical protein
MRRRKGKEGEGERGHSRGKERETRASRCVSSRKR